MQKKTRITLCLAISVGLLLAGLLLVKRLTRRQFTKEVICDSQMLLTDEGECTATETRCERRDGHGTLFRRSYAIPNGDSVTLGRLTSPGSNCDYGPVEQIPLSEKEGTVWWYDAALNAWQSTELSNQTVTSRCILVQTAAECLFFWCPISYAPIEDGSLRETASYGWLQIQSGLGGFTLSLYSSYLHAGERCDYTVVRSASPLLELTGDNVGALWSGYTNTHDGRWCYDGYYFPSPENYTPTGCLYRCPAAYLAASMVALEKGCRLSDDLSLMMLDTMRGQQNSAGYIPTLSQSDWLFEDYGLGTGFFDTRFNADLITTFCRSHWTKAAFSDFLQRWLDFYVMYAEARHSDVSGGWLVWDYGDETLASAPTLTALNHQLAEICALLELETVLDDPRLRPLAEKLLLGIEAVGDDWIREDGDLYYARNPDGSFGRDDYPDLTYTDMLRLQALLEARGLPRSPVLDRLMEAKRVFLSGANGS